MVGSSRAENQRATASLAASMNSSTIRWARLRGRFSMPLTVPGLVDEDLGLGEVEVDGAAPPPHGGELLLELAHGLELRPEALAVRHLLAGEHLGHLGVGAARGAPHPRLVDLDPLRLAARSMVMSATMQSRSTSGLREQMPLLSRSGSMGSTCMGK